MEGLQDTYTIRCTSLYQKALEFAQLTGKEQVADVYCGIGTISLFLAQQAGQVIGIESVTQAVQDAKENAKTNNITNCKFIAERAENWLPKWVQKDNQLGMPMVSSIVDCPASKRKVRPNITFSLVLIL